MNANWWIAETLCYLTHLELAGAVTRDGGGGTPDVWRVA